MNKGGSKHHIKDWSNFFRYGGLILPLILATYGFLIPLGMIETHMSVNFANLLLLFFWWAYASVIFYLAPCQKPLDHLMRLVTYHLLAGSYLVFVSGVSSLFVYSWLILMIVSYKLFSKRGLILSTLSLVLFIVIDILLWNNSNITHVVNDLIILAIVLGIGLIFLSIFQSKEIGKLRDNINKDRESLQNNRVTTIVNNLTDAILSTDENGIINIYNAASLNLLDTNDSLNGRHIDDVLQLTDKDNASVSIFKECQKIKTAAKRDDLNHNFSDDEQIRLEITYAPIKGSYSRSKLHQGYILIMRDVTKEKSLEEERDEFISVTSHELRTPITIAEGTISNVQIMLNHPDATQKMIKEAVDTAHDQIIFLANMVNDLSTLSRAERGVSDTPEDIDVRELAHKLHDKYQLEAKQKKLHLNLDLSPKLGKVRTSRLYLEELLQDFITNALKYTKEGSVTLIFSQKDDKINFAIKDTGIGVSKTDQTKIFGKFYRSEDYRTRETSGTGLGLYIAAKLAKKIGTKIELTSRLNFGSTFSFSLPEQKD